MTTFISPALIARVYSAFDHDQRGQALTLLRQAFFMQRNGIVEDNQFITELEQMAAKNLLKDNFERAEALYRLALDLYEKCFPDQHLQAICCFGGLAKCLQAQQKASHLSELLRWDDLILARVREAERTGATTLTLFADYHAQRQTA